MGQLLLQEEDLLSIPPPEENIQRTFVGVLSSETADKLKAMFRRDFCPEIVLLKEGHKLPPECRLVICCLPQNIRQMYLDDGTVFATLITDAGLSQAMVLIIIFGEKKTPNREKLNDEKIYDIVLRQGQELYMKGRSQTSPLDHPC
ncbi:uncharacterized protein LOC106180044 [Lingula anatina]|uniref:Uncharacterized protein LOC106180044 n=1 Tax=Lingula anatina TaxID=7574 RepID=A0A1S3KAT2_LINAN|nr:uncharacterized protein LOC106180044 [Lingula anatina]|eukprot:XP_013419366.1 uncharacterized protein LOC106180044 [Lingula anatina]